MKRNHPQRLPYISPRHTYDTLKEDPKSYIKWLKPLMDRKIRKAVAEADIDSGLADLIIERKNAIVRKIEG